jgi:hypothetical protein
LSYFSIVSSGWRLDNEVRLNISKLFKDTG